MDSFVCGLFLLSCAPSARRQPTRHRHCGRAPGFTWCHEKQACNESWRSMWQASSSKSPACAFATLMSCSSRGETRASAASARTATVFSPVPLPSLIAGSDLLETIEPVVEQVLPTDLLTLVHWQHRRPLALLLAEQGRLNAIVRLKTPENMLQAAMNHMKASVVATALSSCKRRKAGLVQPVSDLLRSAHRPTAMVRLWKCNR
jgi:hypothetical protein